ncbi:hypothetical protein BGZ94_006012 [Podila epigama]|nr:hypothetical protein BGZ94_006012 [Podila epigama]
MSIDVSNMVESPQEDYQSFQSNLAVEAARFDASNRLMSSVRNVPTHLLIDGHEAMYKDSSRTTKALVQSVLESEQNVKKALDEIEELKRQLSLAQRPNSSQQRTFPPQGDKADYHSPTVSPQIPLSRDSPGFYQPSIQHTESVSSLSSRPNLL